MKINAVAVAAWLALATVSVFAAPQSNQGTQNNQNTKDGQSDSGPKQDGKNLGKDGKQVGKSSAGLGKNIGKVASDSVGGNGGNKNEAVKEDGKALGKSGEDVGKTTANVGVGAAKVATSGTKKGINKAAGALGKVGDKLKRKKSDDNTSSK